ncbi:ROK family protein [Mangrovihabitans endophyticus]|uniref:Xylose repressor n=1 Tax=Mangrovihabitans endophyticus TaxID=1751298 RepID=A0A8J3C3T0_9ACTN|nr:ROK family protein [Mangrovihabitans endophyticus]GGL02915.1 xylose repressor [Mangrovihabitans endophyticus]
MTTRSTELLRAVHAHPGITRAEAARSIGVGTGAATELVGRLSEAALVVEAPARPSGARGRPTTALLPHPAGPLIAAVDITHESWRIDLVELGGRTLHTAQARHDGRDVLSVVAAEIENRRSRYGPRLRGTGVAVPGTVTRTQRLDSAYLDWHDLDLHAIWPDAEVFVAGNDATLAGAAESARGAAVGASVALHLRIGGGLGGAVVDHGRVLTGASGFGGEFGHMPFGDPRVPCKCGAHGCWGTSVDGGALARLIGDPEPPDPVSYARRVIATGHEAVTVIAGSLGRGMAGLVNGLDADVVTLGGLGAELLDAARDDIMRAYRDGLMNVRRAAAPAVRRATLGDDGPIAGAAEEAWTTLLSRLTT